MDDAVVEFPRKTPGFTIYAFSSSGCSDHGGSPHLTVEQLSKVHRAAPGSDFALKIGFDELSHRAEIVATA